MSKPLPQFASSYECRSGGHCARCRDRDGGRALRQMWCGVFAVPPGGADFECPHGKPWGFANNGVRPDVAQGPGTELKKLLAKVGITAEPGCACNARATEMNLRGPAWCLDNLDTITDWLREEAGRRGLPFSATLARMLVKRAVRNASKPGPPALPSTP